jgi:hypothetical protein
MRPQTERFELIRTRPQISGIRVGHLVQITRSGKVLVDFVGNPVGPVAARPTASVSREALSRALQLQTGVLLAFQDNDPARPIIFDVEEPQPVSKAAHSRSARVSRRLAAEAPIAQPQASPPGAPIVGRVVSADEGILFVDYDGNNSGPLPAKTTVPLRNLKDAVLLVVSPARQAIVIGQIYPKIPVETGAGDNAEVRIKGTRVVIEAEKEILLVSGTSKVHLDGRGKTVTTADQIVSRARNTNKVQGGSVQIN